MQTVCSYCGVGCKFEIKNEKLKGMKNYPTNLGLSCAKGASQLQSIDTDNRLKKAMYREKINTPFIDSDYEQCIDMIVQKIKNTPPKKIGFYLSGQMLNEDYYVANKLAKGFIGTPNCDTNSRLCMASAVMGYKKSFGIDYVPVRMEDIDHANVLILIGANPAESHVVLFNKIKKAQKRGLKLVVIDPRETLTSKYADLYIPISPGNDLDLLNLLMHTLITKNKIDERFISKYTNGFKPLKSSLLALNPKKLLASAGITDEIFKAFYTLWSENRKIITAWTMGINQSIQGTEKNLAINTLHLITGQINKQGCGPFSLTGQPNAMGGREVGGFSTTLAVHLEYTKENHQKVSTFWNTKNLAKQEGLTAFEMIKAADKGELDLLIICHTDPVYHLPYRYFVEKAMQKISLVVEINAYKNSETSIYSHICLPATPFGEKEGTQTNLDRTLTRVERFKSKNNLLQDWEIFARIGKSLGYEEAFNFPNTQSVFEAYQKMTRLSTQGHLDIYNADYNALKKQPYVWGKNLFDKNIFFTPNKKANLFFTPNLHLVEKPNKHYPFILLTGRIRDQWHTGTKTAPIKKLTKHKALNFVEIHPNDAKKFNIQENDLVEITSKRGSIQTYVIFSNISQGVLFVPISNKKINYLTQDLLDPLSKEPDYNHSIVRLSKISP